MRTALIALAAVLGWAAAATAQTPAPLKPGTGDDLAQAFCSACHTSNYIIMNSPFLTPDAWKAEVTKMRSAFGAPIDDATAATIVAYLAKNYAVAPTQ
jgi:mono/diheme cytochrome c family protein